ncbi:hypothetical protein CsSME_00004233 [Camellia sinensis var. sinensis]
MSRSMWKTQNPQRQTCHVWRLFGEHYPPGDNSNLPVSVCNLWVCCTKCK